MRLTQQIASGLFFLIFGAIFFWLAQELPMGTAGDMGVGYTPRMLSAGCMLIGASLLAIGLISGGNTELVTIELRPLILVTLMVAGFAAVLPFLGLPLAIVASVLPAAISGETFRWHHLLLMALALATLATVLFAWVLKLQIPVWPQILGF